ncbi:anti-sigma factor [Mameliella alba]|uniref:anti-sigma factor n=2 Tax=Mameliella alba TaxID=561184 RepID=UPI0020C885EC|nr:anti-sigma factor [Mameliella alba]
MPEPMNAQLDTGLPGGAEAGAAEYSLGLMPKAEIAAFEAQLAVDTDLQQDVAAWTEYFASFTDIIPAETPPPQVLRRIEGQVFGAEDRRPVWRQVLPYLVGAVAGAAIAWVVLTSGLLETPAPTLGADLAGAEGLALDARFAPATGVLTVTLRQGDAGEGRVLELWLLPEDGAPVSLALLRDAETLVAVPPALAERLDGARLVVSEEQPGGSPDGRPSGDARAEGVLVGQ